MLLSSSHASSFLCPSSVTSILGVQEGFLNAIISHISVYIEGHSRRKIGATVFHISSITQCSQISLFSFKSPISIWTIQAWKLSIRLISAFRKRNLSLKLAWISRFWRLAQLCTVSWEVITRSEIRNERQSLSSAQRVERQVFWKMSLLH